VLYASANEDYTERPEPAEILTILQACSWMRVSSWARFLREGPMQPVRS